MLNLSRRAGELGTENAFVVLAEVGKLQAEGKDVLSFCIGQPDFDTPAHIRMAGIRAITEGHTGYTPSPGIPALREAVAHRKVVPPDGDLVRTARRLGIVFGDAGSAEWLEPEGAADSLS